MNKLIILLTFLSTSVFSQILPPNSAERQQLIAMGADIMPEDTSKTATHFMIGSQRFFISKSSERIDLGRAFRREKKINSAEEFELLKLINKINLDQGFQFVLYENSVQANIYMYGNSDPKVLARLILSASKIENAFDANPRIYDLVNK
jgi:hypothetical protein